MKVLLLTDIPPCENFTAGLVLSAMVRFVPRGEICCFAVVNPHLAMQMAPEFDGIPIEVRHKPNENWSWLPGRRFVRKISSAISFAGEMYTERTEVAGLIDEAVAFGKAQKVDRVWAVLQGQTIIRMARAVAKRLGVPLHTHVWDPFSWWAKANRLDGITTRRVQNEFDSAIAGSAAVATASVPMANVFGSRFSVKALPVISSHSSRLARTPRPESAADGPLIIGMAGQFYAAGEWLCLIRALTSANWRIAGRKVHIVVMGPQMPPSMVPGQVTFLGWKTQAEASEILSCCDLLYCPYPFDPSMKEVSQFSFPSKLVLYLAAGRPIVFHGPDYSAPAHYVLSKGCGRVATSLTASAIYNEFERLAGDPEMYRAASLAAQQAFRDDFTLESMRNAFNDFIGAPADESELVLADHRAGSPSEAFEGKLSTTIRNRALPVRALRYARGGRNLARSARQRLHALRAIKLGHLTPRYLRRVIKRVILKIPRIQSLRHEIHSLYAETAKLRERIRVLEAEQGLIQSVAIENHRQIRLAPGEIVPDRITILQANTTDEQPSDYVLADNGVVIGRASVLQVRQEKRRAAGKPFLTGLVCVTAKADDRKRRTFGLKASIPETIDTGKSWLEACQALDDAAALELLRLAIADNVGEIVVVAESFGAGEVILGAKVASLINLRLVLCINESAASDTGWLKTYPSVERIEFRDFKPISKLADE